MRTATAYVAAAFCLAVAGGAMAGPAAAINAAAAANPFSALVGEKRERRADRATRVEAERYVLASDNRAFLFEDHISEARVKFLCGPDDPRLDCTIDPEGPSAEIYQLTATRGPRGDVFYKNAEGDTMLRIASYGGATVFWPGESQGLAASKSFGDDAPLRLTFEDFAAAGRRARTATAIISALIGAPIVFDIAASAESEQFNTAMLAAAPAAEEAGADMFAEAAATTESVNATVLADAVVRAAKGVKDVVDDPTGARILAGRIDRVSFVAGDSPGVDLVEDVLIIRYVPDRDIDGRPSSSAVVRFLEESL